MESRPRRPRTEVAAATSYSIDDQRGLAVAINSAARSWQDELWYYNRTTGELNQAVDWMSRAMSLIRPVAAEVVAGSDEPAPLEDGAAVEAIAAFAGGGPGHSDYFRDAAQQLFLPGELFTVVEQTDNPNDPLNLQKVTVVSPSSIRQGTSKTVDGRTVRWPQLQFGEGLWRDIALDHVLFRTWKPDGQWTWLASSNAQAAIPILRRIELIDKRIIAMMVSRLAMNGFLLIPEEGTIGVPEKYKQAPDPFVAMLVEISRQNIAEPGSASAAIPIPIRFAGDLIDKWKILRPEDPLDEHLLQDRLDELGRLGDTMGISRERVSGGMSNMNQWSTAVVSEEEVRILFGPMAAILCGGITTGYLTPVLRLAGEPLIGPNGGRIVCWYDASRLTAKVDKFASTLDMYDRGEASGATLRREGGLSEADRPDDAQQREMILLWQSRQPELSAAAATELVGLPPPPVAAPAPVAGGVGGGSGPASPPPPAAGPPPGQRTEPTTRDVDRRTNPAEVAASRSAVASLTARLARVEDQIAMGALEGAKPDPRGPRRRQLTDR